MRTTVVTGAASGIGAAVRARLEAAGERVLGVDLRDAEVIADLARPEGRAAAAAGIRLNAVAPGAVLTPLLRDGLDHPVFGPAIRGFPIPAGSFGSADQVAAAIAFLLGPDAAFCCGSIFFVDGGSDALLRPDEY